MPRRGLSLFLVVALLVGLLGLSACGGPKLSPEEEALKKDSPAELAEQPTRTEIHLPLPALPATVDPATVLTESERAVVDQLYEGLVSYSSHRQPKLMEAQRLESKDGGKTWEIELRSDLKWSDGSPVTLEDYLHAWLARLAPAKGTEKAAKASAAGSAESADKGSADKGSAAGSAKASTESGHLRAFECSTHQVSGMSGDGWTLGLIIKGARDYRAGKIKAEDLGLKLEGKVLRVTLEFPYPRFNQWLADPSFYPTKLGADGKPLYNGAYVPEGQLPLAADPPKDATEAAGQKFTLVANKDYWDAVNLRIKKLHFQVFASGIEAYEGFRSGLVDYIGDPFFPIDRKRREEASRQAACLTYPVSAVGYFQLNLQQPFFASAARREILYQLLDPRFLTGAILFDGSPAYPDRPSPTQDLKKREATALDAALDAAAKKALTEVGLYGVAGPTLTDYRLMVASSKEWLGAQRIRLDLRRVPAVDETRQPDWSYREDVVPSNAVEDWALLLHLRDGLKLPALGAETGKAESADAATKDTAAADQTASDFDPTKGFDPAKLPTELGYLPLQQRYAMILINEKLVGVQVTPGGAAYVKDWNFR